MSVLSNHQIRQVLTRMNQTYSDAFTFASLQNQQVLKTEIPQQQLTSEMIILIAFGIAGLLSLIIYINKKSNVPEKCQVLTKR